MSNRSPQHVIGSKSLGLISLGYNTGRLKVGKKTRGTNDVQDVVISNADPFSSSVLEERSGGAAARNSGGGKVILVSGTNPSSSAVNNKLSVSAS